MANLIVNPSRRPITPRGAANSWGFAPRGFTLVEILCVVLILGIAAAIIVPSMGSRDDLKVASAARMIMADLVYAQNRAISTQTRHYVIFETSEPQGYRVVSSVTPLINISHPVTKDSEYLVRFGAAGPSALYGMTISGVHFEGKNILSFDELGVPSYYDPGTNSNTALSTSGGNYVEVRCGSQSLRILVEPYTGELKIP